MADEKEKTNTKERGTAGTAEVSASPRRPKNIRRRRGGGAREPRVRSEFDQKIIAIRRVTRVVAGGRRFSFSVALVLGNKKGSVGVGLGKASDTALAIEKASRNAKKNMIQVPLTREFTPTGERSESSGSLGNGASPAPPRGGSSIPHAVSAKYCASEVMLMPAPGKGLAAGSSVRVVLELAGITDTTAKVLSRSKNQLNNAQAAIQALSALSPQKREK